MAAVGTAAADDLARSARVAAPAVATPTVYVYGGRQYITFVAGGKPVFMPEVSDQVVAFALPEVTQTGADDDEDTVVQQWAYAGSLA